jgi:hypothetical protein
LKIRHDGPLNAGPISEILRAAARRADRGTDLIGKDGGGREEATWEAFSGS